jgi:hypothetical protein
LISSNHGIRHGEHNKFTFRVIHCSRFRTDDERRDKIRRKLKHHEKEKKRVKRMKIITMMTKMMIKNEENIVDG